MSTAWIADVLGFAGIVMLLGAVAVTCHYWFLALVSIFSPRASEQTDPPPRISFAIVIPAHDEEDGIGRTLRSCLELDYPRDKFTVYVIADNCSDKTAQIARDHGAECFERNDETLRGKGHALGFAFERIEFEKHDAVVVLDADCRIDPNALRAFNRHLLAGDQVLQANDVASNSDESSISYVVSVGNHIENDLFYAPRSRLRWGVFLRGTGMVLHRDVLRLLPWNAHSIVEDVEYTIALTRLGIPVRFVAEAAVRSDFPMDGFQLRAQRSRWATGNLTFARRSAALLVWEGLRRGRWALADLGLAFLTLSRPLVIAALLGSLLTSGASCLMARGSDWRVLVWASLGGLSLLFGYFLLGLIHFGLTPRRLRLLVGAPGAVLKLILISLRGLLATGDRTWIRTPR